MCQGVILFDLQCLDVCGEILVGCDVLIDVNVVLEGCVVIEDDVCIGLNCVICDSVLWCGVVIKVNSYLEGVELGEGSDVGLFVCLCLGSVFGVWVYVGNFVELKNVCLGEGSKVGYLSYLGDVELGVNCNIGVGIIICNYDGVNKFCIELGDDVFIGLNNLLVVLLKIGDGVMIVVGFIIIYEVLVKNLVFGCVWQKNLENWKCLEKIKK